MIRKFSLHSLVIVFGMLSLVAVSGMGFAASAWQDEWERVLRAAKSEGKLSLIGPLGGDRRDALSQAFQSKYGITVEYHPDAGAGIFPRLNAERKAGLYLWDVLISGTSTARGADSKQIPGPTGAGSHPAGGQGAQILARRGDRVSRSRSPNFNYDPLSPRNTICQFQSR